MWHLDMFFKKDSNTRLTERKYQRYAIFSVLVQLVS